MNKELNQHCSYCNKTIKYQSNWIKHNKTKRHLKNVEKFENNNINNTINIPSHTINISSNAIYGECRYCGNDFKHQSGLSRHEKKCREKRKKKEKTEIEELKILLIQKETEIKLLREQNETLRKENKELKVVNNITNNNTTNNTIVINSVGEENIKGLMNASLFDKVAIACNGDDYNNTAPNPHNAIELVLEQINNKSVNHNIRYTNKSYDDCEAKIDKWVTSGIIDEIISQIKRCPEQLETMLEDFKNETGIIHQEDIDKIIDNLEKAIPDDDELIKKKYKKIIKKLKRFWYDNTKK